MKAGQPQQMKLVQKKLSQNAQGITVRKLNSRIALMRAKLTLSMKHCPQQILGMYLKPLWTILQVV